MHTYKENYRLFINKINADGTLTVLSFPRIMSVSCQSVLFYYYVVILKILFHKCFFYWLNGERARETDLISVLSLINHYKCLKEYGRREPNKCLDCWFKSKTNLGLKKKDFV